MVADAVKKSRFCIGCGRSESKDGRPDIQMIKVGVRMYPREHPMYICKKGCAAGSYKTVRAEDGSVLQQC
jgi:NADH pyrophosphatase NudC (nudix superfamily)